MIHSASQTFLSRTLAAWIIATCLFACHAMAQTVVFTSEEVPLAIDLIESGRDITEVAYDVQLWNLVRSQRSLVESCSGSTFGATDVAPRVVPVPGIQTSWAGSFSNGEPFVFCPVVSLNATGTVLGAATEQASAQSPSIFSALVTVGRLIGQQSEEIVSAVIVDGVGRDGVRSNSIVLLQKLVNQPSVQQGLQDLQSILDGENTPPSSGSGDPDNRVIAFLACAACASCGGATAVSCAILCVGGNWDTPGEGFASCFQKCLTATPGAAPGTMTACAVSCVACGFATIPPATAPAVAPAVRPGLLEYIPWY